MKIYTVETGFNYEGFDIIKVFLNKETAEQYIEKNKNQYRFYDYIYVKEYDVDDYKEELQ